MSLIIVQRTANLNGPIIPDALAGVLNGSEIDAHKFIITATRDGAQVALTGTVTASFLRADGAEVVLTGEIENGAATVTLAQSCYAVPGRFDLTIFVTEDGVKTGVYACTGGVRNTASGTIIDPGQIVPDVEDIVAQYDEMQRVTAEAQAASETALTATAMLDNALKTTMLVDGSDRIVALGSMDKPTVNPEGGQNQNKTNGCMLKYTKYTAPLVIAIEPTATLKSYLPDGVKYCVWLYSSNTVSAALRSITNNSYTQGPVFVPRDEINEESFRIGFLSIDSTKVLNSDSETSTAIRAAIRESIKFYAPTDTALTTLGAAADAKTVGDLIASGKQLAVGKYVTMLDPDADLDTVTTPGNYRANDANADTITNTPSAYDFRLTVEEVASTGRVNQTLVDAQGQRFFRSKAAAWKPWQMIGPMSPIANTRRTGHITTALARNGFVQLGAGDYWIESLDMPEFSRITGVGTATRLICQRAGTLYAIRMRRGCSIDNLTLVGPQGEEYQAMNGDGTISEEHGIYMYEPLGQGVQPLMKYRAKISNVTIAGFAGGAICFDATGGAGDNSASVVNVYAHNCTVGLYMPTQTEYHRVTNFKAGGCYYGAIVNGGNNVFTNCGFVSCTQALKMSNATNDSHGSFVGCTFNHSGENTGKSIELTNLGSGEMFVGCQIFYGSVHVTNCHGIVFDACNFGNTTPITVTGGRLVMFTNCVSVGASQTPVTVTNNTLTKLINCYSRGGTEWEAITT